MSPNVPVTREARELPAIEAGEADPAASEGVRRVLRGLSRQRVEGGGGVVRRPRSPPKRWPRSAPQPPLPARVPPDGRNPPKRPGSGEPWTWRSPRSCGTPCSGAPKRPRSNGLMSSSGRMDRDGSRSAARRPTRKAREPSSTSGREPPLLSGRSAPRTRIRPPACSAFAPDAPWAAGLEGAFSGHSARVGMARDLVASGAFVVAVQIGAMDPGRPRADDQNHLGAVLRVSTGRSGRPGRDCGRDRRGGVGVSA